MNPFTFSLMLLLQRADDALRRERVRSAPDPLALADLAQRRHRLAARLRRSARPLTAAWS